jgi:uncharacterized protein YjbI with pentapeptide repeats
MDRDEALRLIQGGVLSRIEWNARRNDGEQIPALNGAYIFMCDLNGGINLSGADLSEADLRGTGLRMADLRGANLRKAKLEKAVLSEADLREARLDEADLSFADLSQTDLRGARLSSANLAGAVLHRANPSGTDFSNCLFVMTYLTMIDLSDAVGLETVRHAGPSPVGVETLVQSKGQIPDVFLRGCGLSPWIVVSAKLYDTAMTPPQFVELQYQILDAWTKGKELINGCFISYSWADSKFVDKLRDRLVGEGINVWLDKHDMVAGPIQDQVWRAIQLHHAVILVLSEDSVKSDWVENELDMARKKEKVEGRAVLCPVALDDAWRAKVDASDGPGDPSRPLWRTLTQKLVIDFSPWKTKAFDEVFGKLVRGLRVHYGPKDAPES